SRSTPESVLRSTCLAAVAMALLLLTVGVAPGSARVASGPQTLTLYTSALGVQFINTADDRARGATNNPFDAKTNSLRPSLNQSGNGPFPGDVAVYSFALYGSAKERKRLGTAAYTCYFNYDKHALCVAFYDLKSRKATLVASGPIDFDATGF